MGNRRDQILIGLFVAFVGAIAGAISNAIVNLFLAGKISFNNIWIWVIVGSLVALLLFWGYRMSKQVSTIRYGSRVAIRTCDGKFVTADLNRDHQLFGMAQDIKAWEIFEVVDALKPYFENSTRQVHYGDKIGLKALNNSRFVGADLNNENQLTTWASQLRGWETFTLCLTPESVPADSERAIKYGDSFALQAVNDKYVSYKRAFDARLLADTQHIKSWETFIFSDPAHSK